jgi:hypothetical protein
MSLNKNNLTKILKKKNVNQVFFGNKFTNNKNTRESCMVVGVEQKKSESELSKEDLIPKTIEGIKTDVIELPQIKKQGFCFNTGNSGLTACEGHAITLSDEQEKCIFNGSSIGFKNEFQSSTLGLPLFNSLTDSVVGITCNHATGGVMQHPQNQPDVSYFISSTETGFLFSEWDSESLELKNVLANPIFNQEEGALKRFEAGRNYHFYGSPNLLVDKELIFARDYSLIHYLESSEIKELTGLEVGEGGRYLASAEISTVFNQEQVNYKLYEVPLIYDLFYFASDFDSLKSLDVKQDLFNKEQDFYDFFEGKYFTICYELAENEIKLYSNSDDLIYNGIDKPQDREVPSLKKGERIELKLDESGLDYSSSSLYYFSMENGQVKDGSFVGRMEHVYFGQPYCYQGANGDKSMHLKTSGHEAMYPAISDSSSESSQFIGEADVHPLIFHSDFNYNEYSGDIITYNNLDISIINFIKGVMPTPYFIDLYSGKIKIAEPIIGARVFKTGRTTGASPKDNIGHSAFITSTDWSGSVGYCSNDTTDSLAYFKNCIAYSSSDSFLFNSDGDSGSAIFMEDGGQIFLIGIHFAGAKFFNTSIGVAFKISSLFELYPHLKIWNGDYELTNVREPEEIKGYKICNQCYNTVDSVGYAEETHFYQSPFKYGFHKEYDSPEECS